MDGIVWIAENDDDHELWMLTGRFRGHVERDQQLGEEFHDLSAEDAIAWGRERCAVVLIRLGDSGYYSAGERNPDPDEYPVWPPDGTRIERRRVTGFEAMDNKPTDPPVRWDVRTSAEVSTNSGLQEFHEAIRAEAAPLDISTPAPGYPPHSAAYGIEASTYDQALQVAVDIGRRARDALMGAPDIATGDVRSVKTEVYPYRPGEDVSGPGISY